MRAAIAFVLVACGANQRTVSNQHAEPDGADDAPVVVRNATVSGPRPAIDFSSVLPDPTERARWPLPMSAHPVLEPRYDIADALAVPGVQWLDLCGRGIQNRHLSGNQDRVEYLRAWCSVADKHPADAVDRLATLRTSVVLGISDALPYDIANILADAGGADAAAHMLARGALDRDVLLLDTLVATYLEVGKPSDAMDIDRMAIDADHIPAQSRTCARLARAIVSGSPSRRDTLLRELERTNLSHGKLVTQDCVETEHELTCWASPGDGCAGYFADRQLDPGYAKLLRVYEAWPRAGTTGEGWYALAQRAYQVFPFGDADLLLVAALDLAMRGSECDGELLRNAAELAVHVRNDPKHHATLDARFDTLLGTLKRLRTSSPLVCLRELALLR